MSGRITIDLFTTLDGVAQAPGGPDEDTSGGFTWGGWQAPYQDQIIGREIMAGISAMDALVLGRRTYDIFAAYWPQHEEGEAEGAIGRRFAEIPKYVASRGDVDLRWAGSHRLGEDAAASVSAPSARRTTTSTSSGRSTSSTPCWRPRRTTSWCCGCIPSFSAPAARSSPTARCRRG